MGFVNETVLHYEEDILNRRLGLTLRIIILANNLLNPVGNP